MRACGVEGWWAVYLPCEGMWCRVCGGYPVGWCTYLPCEGMWCRGFVGCVLCPVRACGVEGLWAVYLPCEGMWCRGLVGWVLTL